MAFVEEDTAIEEDSASCGPLNGISMTSKRRRDEPVGIWKLRFSVR
jgi:hypothetical protein